VKRLAEGEELGSNILQVGRSLETAEERATAIRRFESSHPDDAVSCEPVSAPNFPANRGI
jgi:hypothetical protein